MKKLNIAPMLLAVIVISFGAVITQTLTNIKQYNTELIYELELTNDTQTGNIANIQQIPVQDINWISYDNCDEYPDLCWQTSKPEAYINSIGSHQVKRLDVPQEIINNTLPVEKYQHCMFYDDEGVKRIHTDCYFEVYYNEMLQINDINLDRNFHQIHLN